MQGQQGPWVLVRPAGGPAFGLLPASDGRARAGEWPSALAAEVRGGWPGTQGPMLLGRLAALGMRRAVCLSAASMLTVPPRHSRGRAGPG